MTRQAVWTTGSKDRIRPLNPKVRLRADASDVNLLSLAAKHAGKRGQTSREIPISRVKINNFANFKKLPKTSSRMRIFEPLTKCFD
jgi:hypothetical protein